MFISLNAKDYFFVYRNEEQGVRQIENDITYWESEDKEKFDFIKSLITIRDYMNKELAEEEEVVQEVIIVSEDKEKKEEEDQSQ